MAQGEQNFTTRTHACARLVYRCLCAARTKAKWLVPSYATAQANGHKETPSPKRTRVIKLKPNNEPPGQNDVYPLLSCIKHQHACAPSNSAVWMIDCPCTRLNVCSGSIT